MPRRALAALRGHGLRVVVVSNWDASLRRGARAGRAGAAARRRRDLGGGRRAQARPGDLRRGAGARRVASRSAAPHVGDSLAEDVAGARAAGIEPSWLNRARRAGAGGRADDRQPGRAAERRSDRPYTSTTNLSAHRCRVSQPSPAPRPRRRRDRPMLPARGRCGRDRPRSCSGWRSGCSATSWSTSSAAVGGSSLSHPTPAVNIIADIASTSSFVVGGALPGASAARPRRGPPTSAFAVPGERVRGSARRRRVVLAGRLATTCVTAIYAALLNLHGTDKLPSELGVHPQHGGADRAPRCSCA